MLWGEIRRFASSRSHPREGFANREAAARQGIDEATGDPTLPPGTHATHLSRAA